MPDDTALRAHLIELLRGGHAHATFAQTVGDFPVEKVGIRPQGLPHSPWQLLEHMRLAQEDMLRFSQSADWVSPEFPAGYWPKSPAPATPAEWTKSVRAFERDMAEFEAMVNDPAGDLYRKFPWGDGQTLLREAMMLADHNAYHLGQLLLVRRLLGAWKD